MTIRSATPANINTVWAAMVAGDTMELATGNYGNWAPAAKAFGSETFVQPASGASPSFTTITVAAGSTHITFQPNGSDVITLAEGGAGTFGAFKIANGCDDITFNGATVTGSTTLSTSMTGYGIYVESGASTNNRINIINNNVSGFNRLAVLNDISDGSFSDNVLHGTSEDFVDLNNVSGSSGASMFEIWNNEAYGVYLSQAAPIGHSDVFQYGDSLGVSANVHFKGNTFRQATQGGVEGDSGTAGDAQFIFIESTDGATGYENFLIEQNIAQTDLGNGILVENLRNSTVQNNTLCWYPDTRIAQLTAIASTAGSGGDFRTTNAFDNNIAFQVSTDNPTADTLTGNVTLQWEFPHSAGSDFAPDLFLDALGTWETHPAVPDLMGLVRRPDAAAASLSGKGAATREADFAPTLYIYPGDQRGTLNSLTYNFDCRVYATDTTASGATDFNWDFGDGTTLSGTDATQSHTFDNARDGPYVVTCTRISDSAVATITVKPTSPYYLHHTFDAADFTNDAEGVVDMREAMAAAWGLAGSFSSGGIHVASGQYAAVQNATAGVACEQAFSGLGGLTIAFDITIADGALVANTEPFSCASFHQLRLSSRTTTTWILFLDTGAEFLGFTHPGNIDDGTKHRIVCQFDGAAKTAKVWDNGTLCGTVATTGTKFAADTSARPQNIGYSGASLVADMDDALVVLGVLDPANETTQVATWDAGLAGGGGGGGGGGGANDNEAFLVGVGDMAIG